jgi:hypothetical protein
MGQGLGKNRIVDLACAVLLRGRLAWAASWSGSGAHRCENYSPGGAGSGKSDPPYADAIIPRPDDRIARASPWAATLGQVPGVGRSRPLGEQTFPKSTAGLAASLNQPDAPINCPDSDRFQTVHY